jgi:hypothetical protein
MRNCLVFIGFLLVLSGCDPRTSWLPFSDSPYSYSTKFMRGLPDGNDSYSTGFRDGCNTYQAIIGTGPLQMKAYQWDNLRELEDAAYAKGISDGRAYCTHYLDPAVT